jgi:uncharacterized protein YdhG (YjbR/CyaY superfamily)
MAKIQYLSVEEYIENSTQEQRPYLKNIRQAILKSIDKEYQECINYGMIGYVVPHSKYPEGYHCDPKQPLPFANIAAQKNFIALYHMGVYANPELHQWFQESYAQVCQYKLNMGKSCIRFKKYDDIPYDLITELFSKMSANQWIASYEKLKSKK